MAMTFGGNPVPSDVARSTQPNTFTQNQTLEGTNNTIPNQTVASGASVMTRDLGDSRYEEFGKTVTIQSFGGIGNTGAGTNTRTITPKDVFLRAFGGSNSLAQASIPLTFERSFQGIGLNQKSLWTTKTRYDALINIGTNYLDSSMNFFVPLANNSTSNPSFYPGWCQWNNSQWGFKFPVFMFYDGLVHFCLFEHFRDSAISRTTNVVSVTTNMAAADQIQVGDLIYIGGASPVSFNTFEPVTVTSISGTNVFTFDQTGSNESVTNAGAAVQTSRVQILTSIPLTASATAWDNINHKYSFLSNGENDATFLFDDTIVASVTGLSATSITAGNCTLLTYNTVSRTNYATFILNKIRFQILE
jgi:hypothetical protein